MVALCPDASLETLRQLCYRGTHSLQRDLCCCFHEGSREALQPTVYSPEGVEVWTPRGPILGADKDRKVPPQSLPSRLGLVGGN